MSTLYIMCGIPGSGKSTIAKSISEEKGSMIICPDSIRKELTGREEEQSKNPEVFALAYERTEKALLQGESVVFDATNISKRDRKNFLDRLGFDHEVIAIVVSADLSTCLRRNAERQRNVPEDVIRRMHERFEMPDLSEGFDKIDYVTTE